MVGTEAGVVVVFFFSTRPWVAGLDAGVFPAGVGFPTHGAT